MAATTLKSLQTGLDALTKTVKALRAEYNTSKQAVQKGLKTLGEIEARVADLEAWHELMLTPGPGTGVPPVEDRNDPRLFVLPPGDPRDGIVWDQWITRSRLHAYDRQPTAADQTYWRGKQGELLDRGIELGQGNLYAWHRLIGMDAGGDDTPTYGPYRAGA